MSPARFRLCVLLSSAAWVVGCERAPPEQFTLHPAATAPSRPTAAQTSGASVPPAPQPVTAVPGALASPPSVTDRCILATPAKPPPPVSAAPAARCPADPERPSRPPEMASVAFSGHPGLTLDVEVVRSEHDLQRGLMYRTSMPEGRGMLFDLGTREDHAFWMHNTCIPLDLLYVDSDGFIVGLVENAPTLNDEARGVGCPSRYVIEVNAGWARRHDVRAGQFVSLPPSVAR